MDEIEDIQEQCDGFSHAVSRAMVRERVQEETAALLASLPEEELSQERSPYLPTWVRKRVLEAYGGSACVYCKASNTLAIDYLVPTSRDGTGALHNLVPACAACMKDRGDTHLSDRFARRTKQDCDPRRSLGCGCPRTIGRAPTNSSSRKTSTRCASTAPLG